jgi:hypothetical protein
MQDAAATDLICLAPNGSCVRSRSQGGIVESSSVRLRLSDWQERGKSVAATVCFKGRGQITQDVSALLPKGCNHGQHSLYESAPMHTVGSTADPPPDHCMPQRSCDDVVRRRNPLDPRNCPQTFLYLEKLKACGRRFRGRAPRPFQKGLLDFPTQAVHPLLKRIPSQSSVAHSVLVAEQPVRQRKQSLFDSLAFATPVDYRLEVSAQMRPADLTPECLDPLIRAEPVATNDLIILAPQESRCDFAATAFGNGKDRTEAAHRSPQPCLATVLTPRRLVDINCLGLMDRSRELVVRGFKGDGRQPFQFGDHPSRDRKSKQVAYRLLDLSLAEATGSREHSQHRLKVRGRSNQRGHPLARQIVSPQPGQVRRWSRYSSTIGLILGSSAT